MAAKLFLANSTVVTNATYTTIYTVPADKAARGRLLFVAEGGGATNLYNIGYGITSGPADRFIQRSLAVNQDVWSGLPKATGSHLSNTIGIQEGTGINLADGTSDLLAFPLPHDIILAETYTVAFYISGGDLANHRIQFVGVEDDA